MRYGSIRYVNNLPVDHGLLSGAVAAPDGLEVIPGTPATLNAALAAGDVDVASVSAVTLARVDGADLVILPEATIASRGRVDSVLLVSKEPFETLDHARIAVTDESATGAALLRVLLERDVGITPQYHRTASDLAHMLDGHDAALVIGDDALGHSAGATPEGQAPVDLAAHHVLDLGEAWRAYTGLPMVYAVWLARGDVVAHDDGAADAFAHADVRALRNALDASRRWGDAHRDVLVAEAARRTRVPAATLATYYDRLTYTLGAAERDGLMRFLHEVAQLDGAADPTDPFALPPVLEAV